MVILPHAISTLPASIRDEEELENLLSEPTPGVIDAVGKIEGDFIVLGVGGKMGPTLARMLRKAVDANGLTRRVIGVSRFSSRDLPERLKSHGIEPISCDLLDATALGQLPEVQNVIYMAGMKFGTTGQQPRTWAMNTFLPGMAAQKFRGSRIVVFSTGNVYPMVRLFTGGCTEDHEPAPNGEYGMSCLGRERIFEHFSMALKIPMTIIRLNYAVEMRYGVIVDLAERIFRGETIDLSMSNFNAIWQGDANAMAIQSLLHVSTPPLILNLTGPESASVRNVSEELGRLMNKSVAFTGAETGYAFLNNAQHCFKLFRYPSIPLQQVVEWTADWVSRGEKTLGKPTHFETLDGKY